MMFCCHCGKSLPEGTKFCTSCGKPTVAAAPEPPLYTPPNTPPEPPQGGTGYLGDGYEEEGTELLSPGAPPPRWDSGGQYTPPGAYAPMPQAAEPRKKRVSPVLIASVILICLLGVAAIIVAVCLSMSQDAAPTVRETDEPEGKTALSTVNWAYYEGLWTVDGASLSLEMEGDDVKLKLINGALVIEGICTPEGDSQRLVYEDGDGGEGTIVITADGDELQVTAESDVSDGFRCSGETAVRAAGGMTGEPGSVVGAGPNSDLQKGALAPESASPEPTAAVGDYLYYVDGQTVSQYPNPLPTVGGDFHFWPTDSVRITDADLQKLTHEEIQAIRNEIYARYGYPFSGEQWQTLFGGMTWYTRNDNYVAPTLPQLVQDNVAAITAYEAAQGWR